MNRTKILVQSTFFDLEDILRYHCSSYQELTVVDLDIFFFLAEHCTRPGPVFFLHSEAGEERENDGK